MTAERPISRRDLLRGRALRVRAIPAAAPTQICPTSQAPPPARVALPVIRPPGAIDETGFLDACTRCAECITACPHDAIRLAPARFRAAQGTPIIDPAIQPCLMCDDTPCVTACPTGALLPTLPRTIANATILTWTCIAYQGGTCSVCVEQCPVPGAITLNQGRPEIDASVCTGCGVCHYVCPAPENSVRIMPIEQRPTPPEVSR